MNRLLENHIHAQQYAKKELERPIEYVKQINTLSIKSVKQKLYTEI